MVNTSAYQPRQALDALIPPGWQARHSDALAGARTAAVELWSGPADGDQEWTFSPELGTEARNHGTLLSSPTARIQRLLTEQEQASGEQDVTTRRYLVALPQSATVTLGNRIKVIDSGDPLLDGRYLSVVDVQGGSLRFERHLIAIDNLEAL